MTATLMPPAPRTAGHHPLAATVAEALRLAVAPSTGRFRPAGGIRPGTAIRAGDLLGHVTGGRGRADEVRSPVDGAVRGLLIRPGQLVAGGQQLVWLESAS
jgi:biotin carboxyl carrier protein